MKGSYTLLIEMPGDSEIEVGRLGKIKFSKGYYAYVGSALNSIESRVRRHLSRDKKKFWHIDYLLEKAEIRKIIYAQSKSRNECNIARELSKNLSSTAKFGSSDCSCRSHLFYSKKNKEIEVRIMEAYKENRLRPEFDIRP